MRNWDIRVTKLHHKQLQVQLSQSRVIARSNHDLSDWEKSGASVAARDDFEGCHLTPIRAIVQAELFDSELEQSRELQRKGYYVAAAVIAGTVFGNGSACFASATKWALEPSRG
jgi:redox-sensitive bicupin YhaK (pirin superfamily)